MKVRLFQDAHQKKRLGARKCPWSVEWRENGRRRSKSLGTKDEAEEFAAVKRAELLDGGMGLVTKKRWADFAEEYLREEVDASGKRDGTRNLVRTVLKTFEETAKPTWVYLVDARTLDHFRRERLKAPGHHGGKLSPETVKKELRHLRAALGTAKRWRYLKEVPPMPKVSGDKREKVDVSESHFLAILEACPEATLPTPKLHEGIEPGDWWAALIATLWVTGMRIDSVLKLRWEDVDWANGRVLSRARTTKQRTPYRPEIRGALPYLSTIRGPSPLLLPWNHNRRTLYTQFYRIQKAAGIELPCDKRGEPGHVCGDGCRCYGFHAFRYAHARFNHDNPQLQEQMGHACRATTDHYRRWADRELATYGAYVPSGLSDGKEGAKQRENSGKDDGKPVLRVVSA